MPKAVLEKIIEEITAKGKYCSYNETSLMYDCDCASTAYDTCIHDPVFPTLYF